MSNPSDDSGMKSANLLDSHNDVFNQSTQRESNVMVKTGDFADTSNMNTNQQVTTRFHDTSDLVTKHQPDVTVPDALSRFDEMSINSWFQVPYLLARAYWNLGDSQPMGTPIAKYLLPHELFKNKKFWSKLRAFRYFRTSFKVSFRLNGTAMHYGQLVASHIPYPNGILTDKRFTTTQLLHFPHVLLSPTENATNELIVPFTLPYNFMDLDIESSADRFSQQMGLIVLWVLSPLRTVSDVAMSVNISTFCSCIDPVFQVLTGSNVDYNATLNLALPDINTLETYKVSPVDNPNFHDYDVVPQTGAVTEAINKATEVVVAGCTAATNIARAVVTTAAELAPLAAMFAGKPDDVSKVSRFQIGYDNTANGDGADTSRPLSMDPLNRIKYLDFPMCKDTDMLITKYAQQFSLFDWKVFNDYVGNIYDILWTFPVSPLTFRFTKTVTSGVVNIAHTNLSAMATLFSFWKGTIKFKFRFVCSQFHSLRLRVFWSQTENIVGGEGVETSLLYNEVWDVQMNSEFVFEIPYYSLYPARAVDIAAGNNGYIGIQVLNSLTAGLSTSLHPPDISMFCFVAGGDDIEFFKPTGRFISNSMPLEQGENNVVVPQGLPGLKNPEVYFDGHCFGEKTPSFNQIARRFSSYMTCNNFKNWLFSPFSTVEVDGKYFDQTYTINIHNHTLIKGSGDTPAYRFDEGLQFYDPTQINYNQNFFNYLFQFFRFVRGSFRVKIKDFPSFQNPVYTHTRDIDFSDAYQQTQDTNWFRFTNVTVPQNRVTSTYKTPPKYSSSADGVLYSTNTTNALAEVTIPWYSNLLAYPTCDVPGHQCELYEDSYLPGVFIESLCKNRTEVLVAAGDDFQYMLPIGAPHISVYINDKFTSINQY